ncbi:hypothetical protein SOVF_138330 [Spinacia oleracea]|nr:hypothetical protein SOVF_138330 [Spinacia oleracea]
MKKKKTTFVADDNGGGGNDVDVASSLEPFSLKTPSARYIDVGGEIWVGNLETPSRNRKQGSCFAAPVIGECSVASGTRGAGQRGVQLWRKLSAPATMVRARGVCCEIRSVGFAGQKQRFVTQGTARAARFWSNKPHRSSAEVVAAKRLGLPEEEWREGKSREGGKGSWKRIKKKGYAVAAIGWIIDDNNRMVAKDVQKVEALDACQAEMKAVLIGLQQAVSLHMRSIKIYTNCMGIINALRSYPACRLDLVTLCGEGSILFALFSLISVLIR